MAEGGQLWADVDQAWSTSPNFDISCPGDQNRTELVFELGHPWRRNDCDLGTRIEQRCVGVRWRGGDMPATYFRVRASPAACVGTEFSPSCATHMRMWSDVCHFPCFGRFGGLAPAARSQLMSEPQRPGTWDPSMEAASTRSCPECYLHGSYSDGDRCRTRCWISRTRIPGSGVSPARPAWGSNILLR